jgi:hypothetical protein
MTCRRIPAPSARRYAAWSLALLTTELPAALSAAALASSASETDGQFIFRFDTSATKSSGPTPLEPHEVIQSSVSPRAALAVGLKVDALERLTGLARRLHGF